MSAILLSSLLVGLFVLFEGLASFSSSSSSSEEDTFLTTGLSSSSSIALTVLEAFAVEGEVASFALRSAISALSAFISFSIASKRSSIVDAFALFTSRVAAAKETSSVFLIIKIPLSHFYYIYCSCIITNIL